jgi:hypothetical protein
MCLQQQGSGTELHAVRQQVRQQKPVIRFCCAVDKFCEYMLLTRCEHRANPLERIDVGQRTVRTYVGVT